MSAIAIITARGGSKRIPRKNVREFAGKPMIVWPIRTALESGLFDRVIVSTDDPEIASVAGDAGAEVPFMRPAELADDRAGTLEVVGHFVDWARSQGWQFDQACCLYGTAAFTTADDLAKGRDRLDEWDYVFAAGQFARPPQRAFVRQSGGSMRLLRPEYSLSRSQDLEAAYYDAGQFYWGTAAAWSERRPIYGERTTFIELPPERAIDIDTLEDWAMAERQFSQWKQAR
ncbi:MAG: pseudaminic acid cytidylyltransferase [Sphingomicrobium sp.]